MENWRQTCVIICVQYWSCLCGFDVKTRHMLEHSRIFLSTLQIWPNWTHLDTSCCKLCDVLLSPLVSWQVTAGMTLYLKTNNLIFCRLSTGLRTGFVHGLPYNSLIPSRRLLRPLGGWSGWQRIFLPRHMGGVLVSGSKVINVSVKPKI